MDVDISDILADISRPSGPSSSIHLGDPYDASTAYTDHMQLTRHWTTERCTPSLQSYPSTLIERVLSRVRAQIARIEDLTSGVYDSTSTPTYTHSNPSLSNNRQDNQNLNLILSILQTDLSRTQFLLRSYLRQRLAKLTRHAAYYLKHHADSKSSVDSNSSSGGGGGGGGRDDGTTFRGVKRAGLLSVDEVQFLTHHQQLLAQLYSASFLSALPVALRRLDDSTGGSARMDEGPDCAEGVFVRCLAAEWTNEVEVEEGLRGGGGGASGGEGEDARATVELRMERGGVLVGRWKDVRTGVERGDLEIL